MNTDTYIYIYNLERVVCYVGTWAAYRSGNGKFDIENINPKLCTHLIYAFAGSNANASIHILDPNLDIDKILRSTYVKNAAEFVKTYGFDGLDFDIEYPAQRGAAASDKENFSKLLKELRAVFKQNGLLLSAAVPATGSSADISYEVKKLNEYLDFISIMAYDYHGSWDGAVGHVAPLFASSVDKTETAKLLNVDASVKAWIQRGAHPQKLNLGIPFYGRTFTLKDPKDVELGAAITGPGTAGPYSAEAGTLAYNEIVELVQKEEWTVVFDDEQMVPHGYRGDQWIGHDDPRSIIVLNCLVKLEFRLTELSNVEYAKSLNIGGFMAWALESDDFLGLSGKKYPLLSAINDAV
nr:unnamed protein product [Callosobruchus chinensis]